MHSTRVEPTDIVHLRRCIELARAARSRGDQPFGSVLVNSEGAVVAEEQNREVSTDDITAHPEIMLARWAAAHATEAERAAMTMFTSGEHCPMCATAHFAAGIGRLVFALDAESIRARRDTDSPALTLSVRDVFAHGNRTITVAGPSVELRDEALALFDDSA